MKGKPIILPLIEATGLSPREWLIRHYYQEGCNLSTAARELGIPDKRTLWTWMKNNGFLTKPQSESQTGILNPFFGKKHSTDSKSTIGKKSAIRNKGELNPAFKESGHSTHYFLRREIFAGNTEVLCDHCGLPCPSYKMDIHHRNKNRKDNRRENLRIFCESCHYLWHRIDRRRKSVEKAINGLRAIEKQWADTSHDPQSEY